MSDFNQNPLGPFVQAFNSTVDQHRAMPEELRRVHNARRGAELLVGGVYTVWYSRPLLGTSAPGLVTKFMQGHRTWDIWLPLAFWACVFLLGAFWLITGLAGRRPRVRATDVFWQAVFVAIIIAFLMFAYIPRDWTFWTPDWSNLALRGLYMAMLVGHGLHLLLVVIGRKQVAAPPTSPPPTFPKPVTPAPRPSGPAQPPRKNRGIW